MHRPWAWLKHQRTQTMGMKVERCRQAGSTGLLAARRRLWSEGLVGKAQGTRACLQRHLCARPRGRQPLHACVLCWIQSGRRLKRWHACPPSACSGQPIHIFSSCLLASALTEFECNSWRRQEHTCAGWN